jgi:2-amino-4-hydroxy-6-hydroxymethyldihydropteridine diphosphokinase
VARAFLGLGSNLGDSAENIRAAVRLLASDGHVQMIRKSSFYLTDPVGYENQPEFTNAVAEVETDFGPEELLARCLDTEKKLGRERTIRWGPRVIDIDVLLYNDAQMNAPGLEIPHPRMAERGFVMAPLAQIAPDLILPDGRTAREVDAALGHDGVRMADRTSWED